MAVLVLAVVMSIAALVAADDDDATTSAASSVHVSLSEFAITPSAVSVPAGGMLHVAERRHRRPQPSVVDTDLDDG